MATAVALDLDTSSMTAGAYNAPRNGVCPEGELLALGSIDEVGGEGSAALAAGIHEGTVAKGAVLLLRVVVWHDELEARLG